MKKLLTLLGTVGITAGGAGNAVAFSAPTTIEEQQIIVSQDSIEIGYGFDRSGPFVVIENYDELSNPTVKSNDESIVFATSLHTLKWTGLFLYGISEGTTTVTISADNAEDTIVTVTVVDTQG